MESHSEWIDIVLLVGVTNCANLVHSFARCGFKGKVGERGSSTP